MNRSTLYRSALVALLAGAATATVFAAPASGTAAYDTYRRVVLGDTQVRVAPQSSFDEFAPRQVTSGYARYLLNNGQSEASVLGVRATPGEVAVYRTPTVDASRFTAYQRYQRYLGQTVPALGDPVSATAR